MFDTLQPVEVPDLVGVYHPERKKWLLFKDRACKKSIRLFSIIARHVTCLSTHGSNASKTTVLWT